MQLRAIYDAALRLKLQCRLGPFRKLIVERGGAGAASHLLAADDLAGGFIDLCCRGANSLRLSVKIPVLPIP